MLLVTPRANIIGKSNLWNLVRAICDPAPHVFPWQVVHSPLFPFHPIFRRSRIASVGKANSVLKAVTWLLLSDHSPEGRRFGSTFHPSGAFHHLLRWGAVHATDPVHLLLRIVNATGSTYSHSSLGRTLPPLEENHRRVYGPAPSIARY